MITFKNINDQSYTGRFGNQILAIASTIGIALKNNSTYGFDYWNYSRYFKKQLPNREDGLYKEIQIKNLNYTDINLNNKYHYEINNHFFSEGKEYWTTLHSYKYFEDSIEIVKEYFVPNLTIDTAFTGDKVAIHIRRGDYIHNGLYHTLAEDYYRDAMNQFPSDTDFIIFTDDKDFVTYCDWFDGIRDRIWLSENYLVNIPDHIFDWVSMQSCKAIITANSSFSLSAAYFMNKKTVAPKNWLTRSFEYQNDLYKPEWSII